MVAELPFITKNGTQRKVGFELEFAGLELKKVAGMIQSLYGGEILKKHRYRYQIEQTSLGLFRVELDAQNLRKLAADNALKDWGIDFDKEKSEEAFIEDAVDRLAQSVVPLEIVMPPVAFDKVEELEKLRALLQKNKAQGTESSLIYAFGMHINIECPDLKSETLLTYLQSFVLLYPWLIKQLKIDFSRRITPFIDTFPDAYITLILDAEYTPSFEQLMEDYFKYNPTRNRPLDMMPIWAMEHADEVESVLEDEKNEARPTFHFRLPNSRVNEADWRLMHELTYWMKIEDLANRPDMLYKLCRLYKLQKDRPLTPFDQHWIETITILLELDAS